MKTYDIYTALKQIGMLDEILDEGLLKYDTISCIKQNYDFYSLLIKKNIFNNTTVRDNNEINNCIDEIKERQEYDGSWNSTVIGTAVNMEYLMELGIKSDDTTVKKGVEFLFSNLNETLDGLHTNIPYGFEAHNMFTTDNRNMEFNAAQELKPEWIPRNVCYRHLAVIQNYQALIVLLRLGMEDRKEVTQALDNLYNIYETYGGYCDSDIKKKYVEENKVKF